jgi:hypothetical protein
MTSFSSKTRFSRIRMDYTIFSWHSISRIVNLMLDPGQSQTSPLIRMANSQRFVVHSRDSNMDSIWQKDMIESWFVDVSSQNVRLVIIHNRANLSRLSTVVSASIRNVEFYWLQVPSPSLRVYFMNQLPWKRLRSKRVLMIWLLKGFVLVMMDLGLWIKSVAVP